MAILPVFITTEHKSNRAFLNLDIIWSIYILVMILLVAMVISLYGEQALFESGMFVHSLLAEVFMRKVLLTHFPDGGHRLTVPGKVSNGLKLANADKSPHMRPVWL